MTTKTITRKIGNRTFVVDVPVNEVDDDVCVTSNDLKRAELSIAAAVATMGPVSGDSFKFMRMALGMRRVALSAELGVMNETICRWETGVIPVVRTAWIVLAYKVLHDVTSNGDVPLSKTAPQVNETIYVRLL